MMDFTFTSQLHYLVHQADGEQVAHCLDLDLVGSGPTVEQAVDQLNDLVRTIVVFCIVQGKHDVSAHCGRAPQKYWDMFQHALNDKEPIFRTLDVGGNVAPVNVMECHFTYVLAIAA